MRQCLVDHAVAFGEPDEGRDLFLRHIRIESEPQSDLLKPHGHFLRKAESSAKVEIAFGLDNSVAQSDGKSGGDGIERYTRARYKGLQKHVTPSGRRVRRPLCRDGDPR